VKLLSTAWALVAKYGRPTTPQGWLAAILAGLFAMGFAIDAGRERGIGDELYPFATQYQIQQVMEQQEQITAQQDLSTERQAAIGRMVCTLAEATQQATGVPPEPACDDFQSDIP